MKTKFYLEAVFLFALALIGTITGCSRTFTLSPTAPGMTPTGTPTATSTLTLTPASPTLTLTLTGSPTPMNTATSTNSFSPTPASPTATWTLTGSPTPNWTNIPTNTGTSTNTSTPTSSYTPTISFTATPTNTTTSTYTWSPTGTWPTWTPTITSTPTATSTFNATATACLGGPVMGDNVIESAVDNGHLILNLYPVSPSVNTTVVSLTAYLTAGSVYNLAVYADNGSGTSPTILLAQTNPQTVSSLGWVTNTIFPALPVTAGTYYWIGIELDSGSVGISSFINGFLTAYFNPVNSNNLPATFSKPVGGLYGFKFDVYANGCPFVPLTPTPTGTLITSTFTYSPTAQNTGTFTNTDTATNTPTRTSTFTLTPTGTLTPSVTPIPPTPTNTSTFTFTANATATACTGSGFVLGDPHVEQYQDVGVGPLYFTRFQASGTSTLVTLSAYLAPQHYNLSLWADDGTGSTPTSILAQTGLQYTGGTGWATSALNPPVAVTNGVYYWLAYISKDFGEQFSSGVPGVVGAVESNSNYSGLTCSNLPVTFSGTTYAGFLMSVYASGCPGALTTPTPYLTVTPTPTNIFTPTNTPTNTVTPTGTWPTWTPTNTPTWTPTYTITFTPTPTST